MILNICDKTFSDIESGVYLDARTLDMPGAHLFIASHKWDEIRIENISLIPKNTKLSVLTKVTSSIKVRVPDVLTSECISLLISLYPDKGGSIRRCFFANGDIREVLSGCCLN